MVDYKYAELYQKDSVDKQLNIVFDGGEITNSDIHSEEFELTESLCSDSQLRFGACEASMIKFRISNIFTPLKGKWLTVTETINHNIDTPFQFGKYKVHSDTPTADRRYRDVVAYDKMYDIINADLTEWYNSLFPTDDTKVTLKEFRDSLMNYLGVEQEDVTLVNDNMVVSKTIQPTQLFGSDVVYAICEINGCFGHIGRDGKFHYVFLDRGIQGLYPANDLYPKDDLFPREQITNKIDKALYIDCKYEDYLSQKITKIQIRQEENDIGKIYPVGEYTEFDNTYVVQGNFLVYGKGDTELEDIAKKLYSVISGTEYRPYEAQVVGNPCLEVGDAIRFNTSYQIVESYILKRTLKGVQGLRDEYAADGEEYQTENNDLQSQIIQIKGKTNILERNVDETNSKIEDLGNNIRSEISQTSGEIYSVVASSQEKYETGSEIIDIYGYGSPIGKLDYKDYYEKRYLDQSTGKLYYSTKSNSDWVVKKTFPLITEELSSRISQTVTGIELTVNKGYNTAGIVITLVDEDGKKNKVEGTIEMTGIVTFNDLENEGSTVINGSNIATGTINCDFLDGGTINGQHIKGGSIEGTDISAASFNCIESLFINNIAGANVFSIQYDLGKVFAFLRMTCSTGVAPVITAGGGMGIYLYADNGVYINDYSPILNAGDGVYAIGSMQLLSSESQGMYIHCITGSGAYGITIWASDTKLKKNIKPTKETALDKVKQIEFVQFDWKSDNSHVDLGVSANQLEDVIPKAVYEVEQPEESEYYSLKNIDNSIMTTYALKAIQEQQKIIDNQQKEIDELKKSVSFLMQKIGGVADE